MLRVIFRRERIQINQTEPMERTAVLTKSLWEMSVIQEKHRGEGRVVMENPGPERQEDPSISAEDSRVFGGRQICLSPSRYTNVGEPATLLYLRRISQ